MRPVSRSTYALRTILCEGCDESWAWDEGDRLSMTFTDWYQMLDEILLEHVVEHPLCWENLARRRSGRNTS